MGSTLEHGIYLPSEGEKNCYQGLASNWNKVDGALGDIAELKQSIESKFTKEIVTELPTEDINPFCIYMILKTDPETDNIYDEWVYINNSWEYLGNTKVDMTQYYTKQEVNQLPAVASGVTATKVGNYDAHIANGDIHVTANDKSKWNTVALIKQLRLVNAQVGSATTIAFANIDDTNGIKVGDKCMDLDGKMFEITAVDATNETVTVGSALVDLALDANVVHTSGNETVSGSKTFNSNISIYNSDNSAVTPNLYLRSSKTEISSQGNTSGEQNIAYADKNNIVYAYIKGAIQSNGSLVRIRAFCKDGSDNSVINELQIIANTNGRKIIFPSNTNDIELGSSSYRWKDVNTYLVNSLEPSSLSLPSGNVSDVIDISSYITDLSGNVNNYTAPANGWITITCLGCTGIKFSITNFWANGSYRENPNQISSMTPICKGQKVGIYIYGSSPTIQAARFIPCQGNV